MLLPFTAWTTFAGGCGAAQDRRRVDTGTALCIDYAKVDQERLHEHVSNQLYTQADRDAGDIQSVHWGNEVISDGGRRQA